MKKVSIVIIAICVLWLVMGGVSAYSFSETRSNFDEIITILELEIKKQKMEDISYNSGGKHKLDKEDTELIKKMRARHDNYYKDAGPMSIILLVCGPLYTKVHISTLNQSKKYLDELRLRNKSKEEIS